MTLRQIKQHRRYLRRKRAQMLVDLSEIRSSLLLEKYSDPLDEMAATKERELAAAMLELKSNLILEIDTSLRCMSDGIYGKCLACGRPIRGKRLRALPSVTLCFQCQQKDERMNRLAVGDLPVLEIPAWQAEIVSAGLEMESVLSGGR